MTHESCPFCGSTDLAPMKNCKSDIYGYYIECIDCGARTGFWATEAVAWWLWDMRYKEEKP